MPATDREVFAYFLQDETTTREIALLAYASYAASKYDWATHFEQRRGRPTPPEEADEWTADLPESRLIEIRDTAVTFFADAATAYMLPQIEEARASALRDALVARMEIVEARVERATSFRATWLPNLFIGVVASFLFALIVLGGAAIYRGDPSIFALFKDPPPAPAQPARP
jgi:hypothetical protein